MRSQPASLPPMTAHDHLAELVETAIRDADTPTAYVRGVFDAFRRFAAVPIATLDPDDADDDMLLAQFGTYHFRGPEEFEVNLTRQIALLPERLDDENLDPEDEDDEIKDLWQISCSLYWPASPTTDALDDGSFWADEGVDSFFRDAAALRGWAWALDQASEMPDLQIGFDPTD